MIFANVWFLRLPLTVILSEAALGMTQVATQNATRSQVNEEVLLKPLFTSFRTQINRSNLF